MKSPLTKCFVFVAVIVLPMAVTRGDVLPDAQPLHRIGHEILVVVATAVAGGSMLIRHLAGKVWKSPEDVTLEELSDIKSRIDSVLPTLRAKFDEQYKVRSVEWLTEDAKLNPNRRVWSVVLSDEELSDFQRIEQKLDVAKRSLGWGWWRRKKTEEEKLEFERKFRKISDLEAKLRNHPARKFIEWSRARGYMYHRHVLDAWRSLCNDLLLSILEVDVELRNKCDGIPIEILCNEMFTFEKDYYPPKEYEGLYRRDNEFGLSESAIRADMGSLSTDLGLVKIREAYLRNMAKSSTSDAMGTSGNTENLTTNVSAESGNR